MQLFKKMKKKPSGLALMELIIALGILGAITAAVVALAARSISASNLNEAIRNITEINVAAKNVFKGKFILPAGAATETQKIMDILTDFGAVNEGVTNNPLGGNLELSVGSTDGEPNSALFITLKNISTTACLGIVQQLFSGVQYMEVKTSATADPDLVVATPTLANGYLKTLGGGQTYSIASANTACASGNLNIILGTR